MTRLISFALLLIAFAACKPNQSDAATEPAKTPDTAQPSAPAVAATNAWAGFYKGVTPCADCEGIETSLTLNADTTYALKLVYLGKNNTDPVEAKGRFRWNPADNSITLDGLLNIPSRYTVGQNMLMQMDMTGQPISGALAGKYILIKQSTQVVTIMKK